MKDEADPPSPPDSLLHTIRLRGAWGRAPGRHTRPFGWPAALDPHERVWLVAAHVSGPATVWVNAVAVASVGAGGGPVAADITALLRPRNLLEVESAGDSPPGEIGLEVRAAVSE